MQGLCKTRMSLVLFPLKLVGILPVTPMNTEADGRLSRNSSVDPELATRSLSSLRQGK